MRQLRWSFAGMLMLLLITLTHVGCDNGSSSKREHQVSEAAQADSSLTIQRGTNGTVADAMVRSDQPDTNLNTTALTMRNASPTRHGFVRWDISSIPTGSTVTSAVATFWVNLTDAAVSGVNVHAVTGGSWGETTITWNNAPATSSSTAASLSGPGQGAYATVTLTALVQSWVSGSTSNYGVMLERDASTGQTGLATSEDGTTAHRPQLVVTYVPPCDAGYADCNSNSSDGCEINLTNDANHCGSCSTACSYANAAASCVSSSCAMGGCNLGFADCNSNSSDGCETTGSCSSSSCVDAAKNGNETDIDCGGGTCDTCAVGKTCLMSADCASGGCLDGVCVAYPTTEYVWYADANVTCGDGSSSGYAIRAGTTDSDKLMLFFAGGGQCFKWANGNTTNNCNWGTAGVTPGAAYLNGYGVTQFNSDRSAYLRTGILSQDPTINPLAGYAVVFVPYCTGDLHLGDRDATYSCATGTSTACMGGVATVRHRGYPNSQHILSQAATVFTAPTQVIFAGVSAGSAGVAFHAITGANLWPNTERVFFGDSFIWTKGMTYTELGNEDTKWGSYTNVGNVCSTCVPTGDPSTGYFNVYSELEASGAVARQAYASFSRDSSVAFVYAFDGGDPYYRCANSGAAASPPYCTSRDYLLEFADTGQPTSGHTFLYEPGVVGHVTCVHQASAGTTLGISQGGTTLKQFVADCVRDGNTSCTNVVP